MRRAFGAVAAVLALTASGCVSEPDVHRGVTDVEVLAGQEAFVAASIAELEDFPGFEERHVLLESCVYGMRENKIAEGADKVRLTYRLPESFAEDPAAVEALATELQTVWEAQGHVVDLDYEDDGSLSWVAASTEDDDEITAWYHLRPTPRIELMGIGCVRFAKGDFVIPEPLGGVTPENDFFENHGPRPDPDD